MNRKTCCNITDGGKCNLGMTCTQDCGNYQRKKYKTVKTFIALEHGIPSWISEEAFDDCNIPAEIKYIDTKSIDKKR